MKNRRIKDVHVQTTKLGFIQYVLTRGLTRPLDSRLGQIAHV